MTEEQGSSVEYMLGVLSAKMDDVHDHVANVDERLTKILDDHENRIRSNEAFKIGTKRIMGISGLVSIPIIGWIFKTFHWG